ncbi:MAG: S8 family serine peptidase, partial [Acidimicrobiia bacterium]
MARAALDETTPDGGPPPSAASEPPEGAESEGFLVRLEPGVGTEDAEHLLDGTGAEIETESVGTGYVHITSSDAKAAEVLERLSESQLVETAEPNLVRRPAAVPDDPYYASNQAAYFRDAGIPAAWDVVTGADNLVLAVLDSGVDLDHPDLAGRLVPGWDVVDDDSRPDDDHGHGTMVAGVAAARTGNGRGVAGVAWRGSIMPVKVMSSEGFATDADVAEGIVWATDHGADVINLSLAAPGSSTALQSAVDYALAGDVVVVAAAGNDASSVPNWPAAARGVIAVGAVDRSGARAAFSSFGSWVDLVAPGVELATTANDGGESYALADGTSFASPLVAGVALLVRAYDPGAGPAAVADRLVRSATDRGAPGPDPYSGAGVVN